MACAPSLFRNHHSRTNPIPSGILIGGLKAPNRKMFGSDLNLSICPMTTSLMGHASSSDNSKIKQGPDHLLVLVHGIMASPSDWIYAEEQLKRRLGSNFLIYASSSNSYTKTFGGIDGAGRRLADEVCGQTFTTFLLDKHLFSLFKKCL
ncbi:hypothetical protein ACMD2_15626 [Ananas comosus]|uniref:DUF676 domain-containing protein n=1 Tax=Ananas comosus TaxID=4615 RepID=A0A199W2T1_ANACO|nr:hypothetical protein ACMD2_15626 [Ananas comosus]